MNEEHPQQEEALKKFSIFKERKPAPVKLGRPKKEAVLAVKKGHRAKLGRPVGEAGRIAEFKARLLATNGDKIINTLIAKALDGNDKDQMAALKMCVDRVLPLSLFEDSKNGGSTPQVTINISSLGSPALEMVEMVGDNG